MHMLKGVLILSVILLGITFGRDLAHKTMGTTTTTGS